MRYAMHDEKIVIYLLFTKLMVVTVFKNKHSTHFYMLLSSV